MKKTVSIIISIAIAVSLAGCGAKEINVKELALNLSENGQFAEPLSEVSSDITQKRYGIKTEDVEEVAAYAGTKAVVDEVAVFKAANVEKVTDAVEKHIASQKDSYESYRPDEVPKLENNVFVVEGDYVIICVSEDSEKAEAIVEEYTK